MLRPLFAFALFATLLCGSFATMAATRYVSGPPAADLAEALPDRIADLFTVSW